MNCPDDGFVINPKAWPVLCLIYCHNTNLIVLLFQVALYLLQVTLVSKDGFNIIGVVYGKGQLISNHTPYFWNWYKYDAILISDII